ncbi:deoxyribose-phosphate aldolase [Ornithinimicrobium sp. Arc0846-15]|nr:deoxyribose-phosphate aldolase [Ornithinimicrobium laminariae]
MSEMTPGTTMTVQQIADLIDHALLKPELTPQEVEEATAELAKSNIWSVCVRPSDVALAAKATADSQTRVCTVIGFPHGTTSTEAKVAETKQAISDGATELDMVLNIGRLKGGQHEEVQADIAAVVEAGHKAGFLVKVIMETALLTDEEKVAACQLSEAAGADFVKTSTGFAGGGATLPDVRLMRANSGPKVAVKASGGVRDIETALAMVAEGVTRLGTSSTVALLKGANERNDAGTLVVPEPGQDVAGADGTGY